MPLSLTLELLPVADTQIVEALKGMMNELSSIIATTATFQWRLLQNDQQNSIPWRDLDNNATIHTILEQSGEVFLWCMTNFQSTDASPHQANQANGNVAIDRRPDGSLTVQANFPDSWGSDVEKKTLATIALRHGFARYAKSKVLNTLSPEISDFYSRR